MTANEDPAAGPEGPADDLEDWLSDLRTDEEPGDELAAGPAVEQPSTGGRHRAPE